MNRTFSKDFRYNKYLDFRTQSEAKYHLSFIDDPKNMQRILF